MWWTVACMCACAALTAATHNVQSNVTADTNYLRTFKRDGHILTIEFVKPLKEQCTDWTTLDSMALQPSFRSEPNHCAGSCYMNTIEILEVKEMASHPPLQALEQCDELREFSLYSPHMEALPERLLARCPQVELLRVTNADRLVTLPPKLLENATTLVHLMLTHGVLESLPAGLLDNVPKLHTLNLQCNRLQTLPSGLFLNQAVMHWVNLSSNLFESGAVRQLAGLHTLDTLYLSNNTRLEDLCHNSSDYSPLLHMKNLSILHLSGTSITHTCRDWRQNLTALEELALTSTKITEIQLSDLQYIRNKFYIPPYVFLSFTHIRHTEEDYKAALVAPRTGANVYLWGNHQCECEKRWVPFTLFPNRNEPQEASESSESSPRRIYVQKCSQQNATCRLTTSLVHYNRR